MMTFRQKIFLSYVIIFLIFAIFLYPLTTNLVEHIHQSHLIKRVELLARELQKAPSEAALIELLKKQEALLFFRVTLYNPIKGYLFDSKQEIDSPDLRKNLRILLRKLQRLLKMAMLTP